MAAEVAAGGGAIAVIVEIAATAAIAGKHACPEAFDQRLPRAEAAPQCLSRFARLVLCPTCSNHARRVSGCLQNVSRLQLSLQ